MINLFIHVYSSILLTVAASAGFVFFVGFVLIVKRQLARAKTKRQVRGKQESQLAHGRYSTDDMATISGDDVVATQLDLARAYLEAGKAQLAKSILEFIAEQGSSVQQQEVRRLLNTI